MASTEVPEIIKPPKKRNWLLILIFLIGLGLRLYGIQWGIPHFFHPDERQIMFKTTDINKHDLNPHFFAYGSFPIYLLKGVVIGLDESNKLLRTWINQIDLSESTKQTLNRFFAPVNSFKGMTLTGRAISALLSAWTIIVVFALAKLMYKPKVAYLSAFFFAVSVLSIQQAHFYVVDGPQTFFITCAMLFMVKTAIGERSRDYYYAGFFIGLAMATKFSTTPIYLAYFMGHFLSVLNGNRKGVLPWIHWIGGLVLSVAVMTAGMPFWILDHEKWWRDIREQSRMVSGAARLPYTIQYEHTTPFWFLIKNMVLWSLGLPLGVAALIGFARHIKRFFSKSTDVANRVVLMYIVPIFILNSVFQVKFLRYTLPLIPFFVIFAAKWLYDLQKHSRPAVKLTGKVITGLVLIGTLLWAMAFMNIYRYPNTRVEASNWVYSEIPDGANILIESNWDDALPVGTDMGNPRKYNSDKLDIYREPDNEAKAREMAQKLEWADIIILASKRHYGSVLRVPDRYPVSGNFYKSLFTEKLGFKYVQSFTMPPHLGPMKFRDDLADESFRVYEHPKVCIFQKETGFNSDQLLPYLINPPPDVRAISYNQILTAEPSLDIGPSINFPVIRWLITLEILGIVVFPMVFLVFNRFNHKGYPLAKVTGLLIIGYICWLLPSLKVVHFSRCMLWNIVAVTAILNWLIFQKYKVEIKTFLRRFWWSIAGYEILFLLVFMLFALLKSYNPDIYWSESSMDFGFINSILRADTFPPLDPWIEGETINYYYYGHYLAAFVTKLAGVDPSYAYNLFFATIPALVALAVASIVITLTRRMWAGVLAVVFTIIIGNLDGVAQTAQIMLTKYRNTNYSHWAVWFHDFVDGEKFQLSNKFTTFMNFSDYSLNLGRSDNHFRFFRSAHELIQPTVHEFPFWSYNFMDLHAHTIATLISSFVLALHLVLFNNKRRGMQVFGSGLTRYLTLGTLCIALGALFPTNSWDFPTHCLVIFFILNILPASKRYDSYDPNLFRIKPGPDPVPEQSGNVRIDQDTSEIAETGSI
ncbi:glycosyltransferase family 39 protein, partial [bacterium]|nr:glycosyltransferase family 39 protein [candidate division CSSED10-310 bacterium]